MLSRLNISSHAIQAAVAVLIVGFLTTIALIKFYIFITCTYYRNPAINMKNKTVIITGGNGGIGKETAKEIAKRGAKVILACRNQETANSVKDTIIKDTGNFNVIVKKLDLASQKSIRAFAEDIINTESRIDVLLHNAGTVSSILEMTEDNLELTMATNHFGPFLLTHLLIDLLKKSAPSRIVIVSSELYRLASLNLNKLNRTSCWFTPYIYYVSKYANICFTKELAQRLEGTGVTANCLHPGLVNTDIWETAPLLLKYPLKLIIKGFFKTPVQGCQTSVYVTCAEDLECVTGKYFAECQEKSLSAGALNMYKSKKLWELSENLTNLKNTDPKI